MKKSILLLSIVSGALFFSSCKKDDPVTETNSSEKKIRFEFTADAAAQYHLFANADTLGYDEVINTASWSKVITVKPVKQPGRDTATLFVLPPDTWMTTHEHANITMKIFVDDVEKVSKSMELAWVDRPAGNNIKIGY